MKLKSEKLMKTLVVSLALSLGAGTLSSCNSGLQTNSGAAVQDSSNNGMLVTLKDNFETGAPLSKNQSYVLVSSDSQNNILAAQVINCSNFDYCKVSLTGTDKASSNRIYLRILNNSGGLIAASSINLDNYSAKSNHPNSSPVVFSEVSTGNYILDKMSQVGFALLPGYNGDIDADLANKIGLDDSDYEDLVTPIAAYMAANSLGLNVSETDGILRLWHNIYGYSIEDSEDAEDYVAPAPKAIANNLVSSLSASAENSSTELQTNSQLGINYSDSKTLLDKISVANVPTILSGGSSSKAASLKAGGAAGGKLTIPTETAKGAQQALTSILKSVKGEQAAATKEQQETIKIAKGVLALAFGAINTAAPGVGTVLSLTSDTLFDFFYPESKSNPNSVLVTGLNQIDQSVNRLIDSNFQQSQTENMNSLYGARIVSEDLSGSLSVSTNNYTNILQSGSELAAKAKVNINESDPEFVYASLADDYITYSDNKQNAIDEVKGIFNNLQEANSIVKQADQISNRKRIEDYMNKLNKVRSDNLQILTNNIYNYKTADYGNFDYIQIDEGYYANIISLETTTLTTLEKARNLQLGAVYLKLKSKYKNSFGSIYIAEEGVGSNYEEAVKAINKNYKARMTNVVTAFNSELKKTSSLSEALQYYEPGLLDVIPGQTEPVCSITYWDGVNLETSCKGMGPHGKDLVERINNVKDTCGENKINLHGTRLYCTTQLVANVTMLDKDSWLKYKGAGDPWASLFGLDQFKALTWGNHVNQKRTYWKDMDNKNEENLSTRLMTVASTRTLGLKAGYLPTLGGSEFAVVARAEWYSFLLLLSDMRDIWMSLGCVTSDCKLTASDRTNGGLQGQEIYFSNGDMVTIELPYSQTGRQTFYFSAANTGTKGRPLPSGNWIKNCDPASILFYNGVLTARCSNGKWDAYQNNLKVKTTLNVDKQCFLGSPLTTDQATGNLVCKQPRS